MHQNVHQAKTVRCKLCQTQFKYVSNLRKHKKLYHGDAIDIKIFKISNNTNKAKHISTGQVKKQESRMIDPMTIFSKPTTTDIDSDFPAIGSP